MENQAMVRPAGRGGVQCYGDRFRCYAAKLSPYNQVRDYPVKLKRFILFGVGAGFSVPVVLWSWSMLTDQIFGLTQFYLWPSSIVLMATEDPSVRPYAWLYMAVSVALNILLYLILASVLYGLLSLGRAVVAALTSHSTRTR